MATPSVQVIWSAQRPTDLAARVDDYGAAFRAALLRLASYFAARIETAAKQTAPWTDRTGNARQGLRAFAEAAGASVVITLVHSVAYGIFLELKGFAVIQPTLESFYGPLANAIRRLVGDA